ncbi:secreted lipase [Apiospora rasikravindrae]|uniref:Carboxylic ester hydrolase n=1 Tax=Apiospora rasikravindrae TaxID=990691 RepID=A0ABR1UDJ5_9PEZI
MAYQLIVALSLACLVPAQCLVAHLDYGTFQGAYNAEYNISYWQKIPYAAPPVGENRFRAPQPPHPIDKQVYNSSQTFDMCPQRTVNGSEDCLYLGLYSRPWTEGQPLRPVVVTFYGGGFAQGSASFTIPPPAYPILNVSSSGYSDSHGHDKRRGDDGMLFVYPNYRVNAFGFLPGRQVAADPHSDPNAGLLDQEAALRWTQRHIRHFGGDPAHVSVWGQSAGGGSVIAQTIAAQQRHIRGTGPATPAKPLFRQALASSPFWPKTYRNEAPEAQWRYDRLANLTGCGGTTTVDSLRCLKQVDVQTIREASLQVSQSLKYSTSYYSWVPVIDGTFLPEPLSEVVVSTRVAANRSPCRTNSTLPFAFAMYNTHEGESFIPPGFESAEGTGETPFNSSVASFRKWVEGYLPGFSSADRQRLEELYPESGSTGTSPGGGGYNDTYTRAGLVYRDSVLACPAYWMTGTASRGAWLGEYTIAPAKHASDVYWWNTVNSAQQTDRIHYEGYADPADRAEQRLLVSTVRPVAYAARVEPVTAEKGDEAVVFFGFWATGMADMARHRQTVANEEALYDTYDEGPDEAEHVEGNTPLWD